jgi:hypothetical protein
VCRLIVQLSLLSKCPAQIAVKMFNSDVAGNTRGYKHISVYMVIQEIQPDVQKTEQSIRLLSCSRILFIPYSTLQNSPVPVQNGTCTRVSVRTTTFYFVNFSDWSLVLLKISTARLLFFNFSRRSSMRSSFGINMSPP